MPKAVVAGASGFIGKELIANLEARGYEVATIGRSGPVTWDEPDKVFALVDGADLLINMAGKNVGCRYHDAARNEILRSRVQTTHLLNQAVSNAAHPPRLWLNSSTATIYRHATDHPQTESTGELGQGFSVDIARNWEREFFANELPQTRRVALRMAIVLGQGPATQKLLTIAKLGLGGPQYDGWWPGHRRYRGIGPDPTGPERSGYYRTKGQQRFSWVHIEDCLRAITFIDQHPDITGVINIAAPNPVTNKELMATLRRAVGAPVGLPAYRWMLEPAMFVLRVEPEMLLKSRWVTPEKLMDAGFNFKWANLQEAIVDLT